MLDQRGKLLLWLLVVACAAGAALMTGVGRTVSHLEQQHGIVIPLFDHLWPLFALAGVVVIATAVLLSHLAGRLADAKDTLEQRVAERTRDYEESQHDAQKAANLLREAVAGIAQGFTIYDENDRLVVCNETYKSFYQASRDLIVPGNSFEEIVRRGAERGQYDAAIGNVDAWVKARVAQHQAANGQIIEQQLGDGRWLLIVEHRTPSGYIVGNRIDITALKHTESALRQRELYLSATLDNLPFMFWLKDARGRFLAVNKVFSDACGRPGPTDIVGLTDLDVWPRELAESYRADDAQVMASGTSKTVEEPLASATGVTWMETYKKPVLTEDGAVLGTVGFAHDVSDRRHAAEKISEHGALLTGIFDLSPDGFVAFDRNHRIKLTSPSFLELTGLTESEVIGRTEDELAAELGARCLPNTSFPGFATLREQSKISTPAGAADQDDHATRPADAGTTPDTKFRPQIIELASPGSRVLNIGLRLSESGPVSQIFFVRDITHETEVERLKSEFLSTAAHELRTPMASIYGFTELLLAKQFEEAEQRDFLATIYDQSKLMISIINELLDLARIEARGGKDFSIAQIDAGELLRHVVTGFKTPQGRASPQQHPVKKHLWVRADRMKLTQAINNVISNAYKYSPDGGAVDISLVPPTSDTPLLGIRITDRGIGMTPEQLARVSERFYRADASGQIPGTGLGMSIVQEIVELHGGHMELASKVGAGTTVTLWLPQGADNGCGDRSAPANAAEVTA